MKTPIIFFVLVACLLPRGAVFSQESSAILGEVLVQLAPGVLPASWGSKHPGLGRYRLLSARMNIWHCHWQGESSPEIALAVIRRDSEVLQAQWNHRLTIRSTEATIPSDPRFSDQWSLNNTGQTGGLVDADIDAPEAWDLSTGQVSMFGDSLVVAVIDDGFDLNHLDLRYWVHTGEVAGNGIDDDGNGYVDDVNGWNAFTQTGVITSTVHGTHVSGIAAARTDNGLGIAGVAWGARILPVQVGTAQESELVSAYGYVLDQRILYEQSGGLLGAYVVATNTSFGVDFADPADFPIWCAIYDSLGQRGILSSVATMNVGQDVDLVNDMPSACASDHLITVTNTTANDLKSIGAAFGLTTIDLGAPGQGIPSTVPGNAYGVQSGTSMASPHVAGAILLMHARACPALNALYLADPSSTNLLMKAFVLDGTDSIPDLQGKTVTGGRLNLATALAKVDAYCANLSNACLPAFALSAQAISDSSASLQWKAGDSAVSFVVRYRISDGGSWIDSLDTDSPFVTLTQLQRCQQYVFQVKSYCPSDTNDYLASGIFQTEGCCEAPEGRELLARTDTSVLLRWESVFSATAYVYRLRALDDTLFVTGQTIDTTLLISGLAPCGSYEWQVATQCDTLPLRFSPWEPLRTLGCGTCLDSVYCASAGFDTEFEWIESVQIGDVVFSSGNNQGYRLAQAPYVQLFRDSMMALTLVPGYSLFNYDESWRIWLDFDQDGEFDDPAERIFDSQVPQQGAISSTLAIPAGILPGITRMRVSMKFSGFTGTEKPTPCEIFQHGEVEDYCVEIVDKDSILCGQASILAFAYDPVSQLLSLQADSLEAATSYEVTLIGPGFPTALKWEADSTNWEGIVALEACEMYEVSFRAVCDQVLGLSDQLTFWTAGCGACIDLPYCDVQGENSDSVWVDAFQLGSVGLATGNDGGYRFFEGVELILSPASQLNGWVWAGAHGVDSFYLQVLIDVNADGQFDLNETVISGRYPAGDSVLINWLVPPALATEGGRVRIIASQDQIKGSCDMVRHGEVEEFCFSGQTVGIDQLQQENVFVFPVPFEESFEVFLQPLPFGKRYVRLYDLQGRQVATKVEELSEGWIISTSNIPSGIYLLEIITSHGRTLTKVLKQAGQ